VEPRGLGYSGAGIQGTATACNARPSTIQDLLTQLAQAAVTLSVLNNRIAQCISATDGAQVDSANKAPSPMDVESRLHEIGRSISDAIISAEKTLKSLGA
jgi:hypothetical protein